MQNGPTNFSSFAGSITSNCAGLLDIFAASGAATSATRWYLLLSRFFLLNSASPPPAGQSDSIAASVSGIPILPPKTFARSLCTSHHSFRSMDSGSEKKRIPNGSIKHSTHRQTQNAHQTSTHTSRCSSGPAAAGTGYAKNLYPRISPWLFVLLWESFPRIEAPPVSSLLATRIYTRDAAFP